MIKNLIDLAEKGILPDFLIRSGIRRMQKERILWSKSKTVSEVEKHHQNWVDEMKKAQLLMFLIKQMRSIMKCLQLFLKML